MSLGCTSEKSTLGTLARERGPDGYCHATPPGSSNQASCGCHGALARSRREATDPEADNSDPPDGAQARQDCNRPGVTREGRDDISQASTPDRRQGWTGWRHRLLARLDQEGRVLVSQGCGHPDATR